jgi:hypothetical protein
LVAAVAEFAQQLLAILFAGIPPLAQVGFKGRET